MPQTSLHGSNQLLLAQMRIQRTPHWGRRSRVSAPDAHFDYPIFAPQSPHGFDSLPDLLELRPSLRSFAATRERLQETQAKREPLHRLDIRHELLHAALRALRVDDPGIPHLGKTRHCKGVRPLLQRAALLGRDEVVGREERVKARARDILVRPWRRLF